MAVSNYYEHDADTMSTCFFSILFAVAHPDGMPVEHVGKTIVALIALQDEENQ